MKNKSTKITKSATITTMPMDTVDTLPVMISEAAASPVTDLRRNVAGNIERTDKYRNIDDGLIPFKLDSGYGKGEPTVNIKDAIILCQKAYYNFSQFRNVIDMMTEFSISDIYFRGGNAKSRAFFSALFKKIGLLSFQDKYFREYYRSGNVFTFRHEGNVTSSDITKITQVFGAAADKIKLPVRYIILNPADIRLLGGADFGFGSYQKTLTDYEVMRLRYPKTEEDKELLNSFPDETKKLLAQKDNSYVSLDLDPEKIYMTFYKKQDYEPFAVPMGFPVLEDINHKQELKKMDMAISRTMQQMILLVTAGTEPAKGGINQKNLEALRKLFGNQSVGRVLVADWTTKAEFVIPQVADILDPKKYEVIDRDINNGLNNILLGGEKFANQVQKTEVFLARLMQARQTFLNDFLFPEIKRISKELGFQNYPTPYFEDFNLKDNDTRARVFTRLMELGILSPEEGLRAIETNVLPTKEENELAQVNYKSMRDKGFYEPLIGGAKISGDAGRPAGTKAPQTTKKISPIGTKGSEEIYSLSRLKENMILAQDLDKKIDTFMRKKFKIKKLNEAQKEVVDCVISIIMANEPPEKWEESVATYCECPQGLNPERAKMVDEVAAEHGIDSYLASLLYASKK